MVDMLYTVYSWVVGVICTAFYGTCAIILSVFDTTGNIVHLCGQLWGKTILKCIGIKVHMEGKENFLRDRSQIIISNHQGILDILVYEGLLPLQFRWIARKNLFDIPILGWSMKRAGYIPIEREGKKKMMRSIMDAVEKVKHNTTLLIFPEGTRSLDGKLGKFKKGTQLIISKSLAPVVPVLITGSYQLLPRGSMQIKPGLINVKVFPPIFPGKMKPGERKLVLDQIYSLFQKELSQPTS